MVGMCMKCGKPIPGVICTACPPDYKSTSRSPKKSKNEKRMDLLTCVRFVLLNYLFI